MVPPIDPSNINHDNIPIVLGVILTQQENMDKKLDDMMVKLEEHDECLEIFKFSKCKVIPWVSSNRWVITAIFALLSIWISGLDWLNRALQWSYFPLK